MKTLAERMIGDILEKRKFYISFSGKLRLMGQTFAYPKIGKKYPIFTIVPSFKCNLKCSYCQYRGLVKSHPDMNLKIFSKILQWLSAQNVRYIRLMGGELTAHPRIKQYLQEINKQNFTVRFFSNLMVSIEKLKETLSELKPENVEHFIVHYKDLKWYNKKSHNLFLDNIEEISKRGYTIHLRHNLIDRNTEYDYAIDLAKKYHIKYFTTTPLFPGATEESIYTPIEEWKTLIPHIIDIYKKCKDANITLDFTKPLPPCFFSKEDFKKYYYKIGANPCLRGQNLFRPIVYPDQLIVFCPGVHMKAPQPLLTYSNYWEIYDYFKNRFEQIRWKPLFEKCNECKYFNQRTCQGLCAGFKFYNRCKLD